jgi:hypothetical protein
MSFDVVVGIVSISPSCRVKVLFGEGKGNLYTAVLGPHARISQVDLNKKLSSARIGGVVLLEQSKIESQLITFCYVSVIKSYGASRRLILGDSMSFALLSPSRRIFTIDEYRDARIRNEVLSGYVTIYKRDIVACRNLSDISEQLGIISNSVVNLSYTPVVSSLSGSATAYMQRSQDGSYDFQKTIAKINSDDRLADIMLADNRCLIGVSLRMSNLSLTSLLTKMEQGKAGKESTAIKRFFSHTQNTDGSIMAGPGMLVSDIKPQYEYGQNFTCLEKFTTIDNIGAIHGNKVLG